IEQDRHVLEIEKIHSDHLIKRRFVLTVDLPIAGQTRKSVHTFSLPRLVMSKFVWQAGPGTDKTHLARKDVEDLRQLIQTGSTQNSTKRCQPWIADIVKFRHWAIDPY